ncbi:signal peptidase I [Capnocytophaga sp. G2]|nr:signal peptidase I [Capnocytophaga sp. G2]MEB3004471.1 signal peptidase I [Capnocytophaga sp. G2]
MLTYLIVFLGVQLLQGILLWKGYQKAGYKGWQAFVPVWNMLILFKIIQRPWWWIFLVYLPVIGNIMAIVLVYEWLHVFGYRKKRYTLIAIFTLGLYLGYITYQPKTQYVGKNEAIIAENVPSWLNGIIYAVVAASAIHTYFIQPYTIPTSSLEKTLLVGDFLFVSKFHYGARLPMTPLSTPMVHDTLPLVGIKSYLSHFQLPYLRLPALEKVKRNDIVVFNWPVDTVRFFRDPSGIYAYKPVDKKSHYVKRAVAIAGDKLEIRDGEVFINGNKERYPVRAKLQTSYSVHVSPQFEGYLMGLYGGQYTAEQLLPVFLFQNFGITDASIFRDKTEFLVQSATEEVAEKIRQLPHVESVTKILTPKEYNPAIFPHSKNFAWSEDNFGPVEIPAQGKTIQLSVENLPLYKRIITEYEGNKLEVKGNDIYVNGHKATTYTFLQDYYWMMGDNRHNSEDSRYWGFVPFDHIVGKPVLIWMSWDSNASGFNKIRWNRLFTTVNGEGEPVSYLYWVLGIGILSYIGYEVYRKRRKGKTKIKK